MKRNAMIILTMCLMITMLPAKTAEANNKADTIISVASKYIGVPYVYGGTSVKGFDCSGFTWFVYDAVGVSLPRTAKQQYDTGVSVERNKLEQGDLVFYSNTYKDGISHVGIYIGNNEFISATNSGVKVYSLDNSYWKPKYTGAKRILANQPAFKDVPANHFANTAIGTMAADRIINGYEDGTFRPDQPITRGQAAGIINRVFGLQAPAGSKPFSDVGKLHSFSADIAAMKHHGVLDGYSDGSFRPDNTITRAQMAKMVVQAFRIKKPALTAEKAEKIYSDIRPGNWAFEYAITLHSVDKTGGFKEKTFKPAAAATRADLAAAVYSGM